MHTLRASLWTHVAYAYGTSDDVSKEGREGDRMGSFEPTNRRILLRSLEPIFLRFRGKEYQGAPPRPRASVHRRELRGQNTVRSLPVDVNRGSNLRVSGLGYSFSPLPFSPPFCPQTFLHARYESGADYTYPTACFFSHGSSTVLRVRESNSARAVAIEALKPRPNSEI